MSKQSTPRIAISGLGPVGMILAIHLQEAGCEIAVCENNILKRDKIREYGVRLTGVKEKQTHFKNLFSSVRDLSDFQPEWIISAIKCPDLPGLLSEIKSIEPLKPKIICAMNGIDTEVMAAQTLGHERVMRMVLNFAGNLTEPNVTKVNFITSPNFIASIDGSLNKEADLLAELLTQSGLETNSVSPDEIIRCVWEKAILNASLSAMCAIGRLTIREAMENPDTLEVIEQTIEEAVEVAEAEKIKFGDDFIRQCLRYLRKGGDHFPSLAVDLINHRQTEIDFINGKIVDYGRKHYVRTSLNLTFTNMVRAMSAKNFSHSLREAGNSLNRSRFTLPSTDSTAIGGEKEACFLGVDLGSAYTKFTVIGNQDRILCQTATRTHNRDKISVNHVIQVLKKEFNILATCATGYGRKHFHESELVRTEIQCAAQGVSHYLQGPKTIIDIGGEDIKVIRVGKENVIENFYLNDKCAAGTGSFLTEVAERADIPVQDMSDLAAKSNYSKELNSFCTVFAKTEIMSWLFEGQKTEDMARGIYLSILNRVTKMKIDTSVPVLMIGGVMAWHPYLKKLLSDKIRTEVKNIENPQFTVSFGAALIAKKWSRENKPEEKLKIEKIN